MGVDQFGFGIAPRTSLLLLELLHIKFGDYFLSFCRVYSQCSFSVIYTIVIEEVLSANIHIFDFITLLDKSFKK